MQTLPTHFLSSFVLSVAVSLMCAFIIMTLQGWLQRLRGCGGLLIFLLVIAALIALASLLYLVQ